MMVPRSPSIGSSLAISAGARRIMLKVPMRLTRITFSKSASGWGPSRPTTRLATPMPAQLTSTRAGPCAEAALAIPPLAAASSATSPAKARPPNALAASSAMTGLRSKIATFAPLAASASAVARPSPDPPPVTIAATPSSFIALLPPARSASAEFDEQAAALDLYRIGREVDAGRRALGFASGEVEAPVVHGAFDDRALDKSIRELDRLVRTQAIRREIAIVRGAVERVLLAGVFKRRDVLRQDPVDRAGVDPALAQLSHSPLNLYDPGRGHLRLRVRRQLAAHEVGRILQLAKKRRKDLAIGGDGARIGGRTIRLDRLVQLGQRVIGDRWEDVVLHVVVHVPIEEPEDRIHVNGAGIQPMVEHVLGQSNMLGHAAIKREPSAVERRQADVHRRQNGAKSEAGDDDESVDGKVNPSDKVHLRSLGLGHESRLLLREPAGRVQEDLLKE